MSTGYCRSQCDFVLSCKSEAASCLGTQLDTVDEVVFEERGLRVRDESHYPRATVVDGMDGGPCEPHVCWFNVGLVRWMQMDQSLVHVADISCSVAHMWR